MSIQGILWLKTCDWEDVGKSNSQKINMDNIQALSSQMWEPVWSHLLSHDCGRA